MSNWRRMLYAITAKVPGFRFGSPDAAAVFTEVYAKGVWGTAEDGWYSGGGSNARFVDDYVRVLVALARGHGVGSVLDIGCGDFRVGESLVAAIPEVSYVGVDVVPTLVERNRDRFGSDRVSFLCSDATRDHLPAADLCLIRQTLQHLSNAEVTAMLKAAGRRCPLVVVTEHVRLDDPARGWNRDIPHGPLTRVDGGSSLRLDLPPFDLPTGPLLLRQPYSGDECLDTFLVDAGRQKRPRALGRW